MFKDMEVAGTKVGAPFPPKTVVMCRGPKLDLRRCGLERWLQACVVRSWHWPPLAVRLAEFLAHPAKRGTPGIHFSKFVHSLGSRSELTGSRSRSEYDTADDVRRDS